MTLVGCHSIKILKITIVGYSLVAMVTDLEGSMEYRHMQFRYKMEFLFPCKTDLHFLGIALEGGTFVLLQNTVACIGMESQRNYVY